ncbi:MAG TPA: hypothetical protein ENK57_03345 [Polyangiaceae bacterium]|nr:hypothetical protein [Polyangiaceae bacterium]
MRTRRKQLGRRGAVVDATNRATGTKKRWHVEWRPEIVECCPGQRIELGREGLPVFFDDHGDPHAAASQCGGCGRTFAVREIS